MNAELVPGVSLSKSCTGCGSEKPLAAFPPNKAKKDGRQARCHECGREYAARRRKTNPEAVRATLRRYATAHPVRVREKNRRLRYLRGPVAAKKAVERATAWAKANPGRAKANKANHRAAKLRATPAWADLEAIREIYKTATLLGLGFHVDHIVPLQGKMVCGLHCEANLRIIPATVNISKHNRLWPDMFEELGK